MGIPRDSMHERHATGGERKAWRKQKVGSWRYEGAQGNDLQNAFGEFGEVKDLHLNF